MWSACKGTFSWKKANYVLQNKLLEMCKYVGNVSMDNMDMSEYKSSLVTSNYFYGRQQLGAAVRMVFLHWSSFGDWQNYVSAWRD